MSTTSERMARILDTFVQSYKDGGDACKTLRRAILVHADDGTPHAAFEEFNAAIEKVQKDMRDAYKAWQEITVPGAPMRDLHKLAEKAERYGNGIRKSAVYKTDMIIQDDPVQVDTPQSISDRVKALKDFYASEKAARRGPLGNVGAKLFQEMHSSKRDLPDWRPMFDAGGTQVVVAPGDPFWRNSVDGDRFVLTRGPEGMRFMKSNVGGWLKKHLAYETTYEPLGGTITCRTYVFSTVSASSKGRRCMHVKEYNRVDADAGGNRGGTPWYEAVAGRMPA